MAADADLPAGPIETLDEDLQALGEKFRADLAEQADSPKRHTLQRALDRDAPLLRTIESFEQQVSALRAKYAGASRRAALTSRECAILMAGYEVALAEVSGKGFHRATRRLVSSYWRYRGLAYWRLRRADPLAHYVGSYGHIKLASVLIFVWWLTSDFGQSVGRWILSVLAIIALFGLWYSPTPDWLEPAVPGFLGPVRPTLTCTDGGTPTFPRCVYFSAVTFTTLGYGDVVATNTVGMLVAVCEAGLGLTMFVILGHMLSQMIVYKQRRE